MLFSPLGVHLEKCMCILWPCSVEAVRTSVEGTEPCTHPLMMMKFMSLRHLVDPCVLTDALSIPLA